MSERGGEGITKLVTKQIEGSDGVAAANPVVTEISVPKSPVIKFHSGRLDSICHATYMGVADPIQFTGSTTILQPDTPFYPTWDAVVLLWMADVKRYRIVFLQVTISTQHDADEYVLCDDYMRLAAALNDQGYQVEDMVSVPHSVQCNLMGAHTILFFSHGMLGLLMTRRMPWVTQLSTTFDSISNEQSPIVRHEPELRETKIQSGQRLFTAL